MLLAELRSFRLLLANEIRLGLRVGADTGVGGRRIAMIVLGLVLLGFGWVAAQGLTGLVFEATPVILAGIVLGVAMLAVLMAGHSLIAVTDAVYTRGDLDLLLSSPISPWSIIAVRSVGIALRVAGVYFIMVAGVLLWTTLFGDFRWLSLATGMVGLALWTTAGALLASMALFAAFGPRATRTAAQVLGVVVGASTFIAIQFFYLGQGGDRTAAWAEISRMLEHASLSPDHPAILPARAFLGELAASAWWLGGAVLAWLLATAIFAARFSADAAAAAGAVERRGASGAKTRAFRGGVHASLMRKEWRLLLRDPVLLAQILLQLIYFVPIGIGLMNGLQGRGAALAPGIAAAGIAAISASLAASLTWVTVSAEDASDLIAGAPAPRTVVERSKIAAATLPVLVMAAAAGALLAVQALQAGLAAILGAAAAATSAAWIGLWHQERGDRKNFRRRPRASWTSQLGQAVVTLSWAGATGLAAGGLVWLALIPALIALGLTLALGESRQEA